MRNRVFFPQQALDLLSTTEVDGIWTSGIDNVIVDAYVDSGEPLVPIVGADNSQFVQYLATVEGFEGAVGMSKKDYVAQGIRDFQKAARQGTPGDQAYALIPDLQHGPEGP